MFRKLKWPKKLLWKSNKENYIFLLGKNFCKVISPPWTTKTLKDLSRPADNWGPMMPQHRKAAGLGPTDNEYSKTEERNNLILMKNMNEDSKVIDPQSAELI